MTLKNILLHHKKSILLYKKLAQKKDIFQQISSTFSSPYKGGVRGRLFSN